MRQQPMREQRVSVCVGEREGERENQMSLAHLEETDLKFEDNIWMV